MKTQNSRLKVPAFCAHATAVTVVSRAGQARRRADWLAKAAAKTREEFNDFNRWSVKKKYLLRLTNKE
jgi:hypothetical protein